jgi:peptidyl-prolyl cis-trans isomerase B (cyclophilin B)
VPSNRDQQLARARAVRRTQRAKERARHRRVVAGVLVGVLVVAAVGVGIAVALTGNDKGTTNSVTGATPAPTAPPSATTTAAKATACGGPAQHPVAATRTFAAEPKLTIDPAAKYTMTLDTSCGAITLALEAAKAPHTVNLLAFLAAGRFYNGTICHRSTNVPGLTVLQCGDPTGTGAGQIGFNIGEENLTGAKYTRGTLAMAKTSAAHSTGSQFFLVDRDSQLPAQYTVAGHITGGLDVLDKLLAIGNDNSNGAGDGAPKQNIYLNTVTVTKS